MWSNIIHNRDKKKKGELTSEQKWQKFDLLSDKVKDHKRFLSNE